MTDVSRPSNEKYSNEFHQVAPMRTNIAERQRDASPGRIGPPSAGPAQRLEVLQITTVDQPGRDLADPLTRFAH
jgi:hypothetical protein